MTALFDKKETTGKWWVDHSLSLVLIAILVVQTIVLLWTGPQLFAAEDLSVPYLIWFIHEYILSVVADTYGVVLIVILSKFLFERGSNESKDEPPEEEKQGSGQDSNPKTE